MLECEKIYLNLQFTSRDAASQTLLSYLSRQHILAICTYVHMNVFEYTLYIHMYVETNNK